MRPSLSANESEKAGNGVVMIGLYFLSPKGHMATLKELKKERDGDIGYWTGN